MSKSMASRVAGIGPTWLERRRLGLRNPLGTKDYIYEQIYSSIFPCECWDHTVNNSSTNVHGGVFSLEFSPEGSLLVAACEKRSILVFDPLTYKEIHTVENAHDDCVNCVRFLDSRSFATCSDDFTVALWDVRNLSQKVRSFKGHTNWVKNIEYCPQDGLLVTSGFDGNILTWEMNKYRESGMVYNKVFATNGLMRTCLTPDASKMVICTTGGYLIVIHNLDLNTLSEDLDGFKPNMYRLMQLSQTILPIASDFSHLFRGHGKRNRVEFITDFPRGDDAEVVSSLQVHPDGHSAISRNVSNGEQSEWSCIHNIEERLSSDESDCSDTEDSDSEGCKTISWTGNWSGSSTSISTTPTYIIQQAHVPLDSSRARSEEGTSAEQRDLSVSPTDVWEALVAIQEARIRRERDRMTPEISVREMFRRQAADASIQVRPLHSGPVGQIFLTRLYPHSNSGEGQNREFQRRETVSTAPVARRNVSINTIEVSLANNRREQSIGQGQTRHRPGARKKLPPLQRYCSLYRRSLVGQYDRTSINRKPIYRPRMANIKLRRLQPCTKLNTNYEMNETQRLQIELNRGECSSVNLNIMVGNERRRERAGRDRLRSGSPLATTSQTNHSPVNAALNSLSLIESNLNSFRETVNSLEGTINSALEVLRSSERQSVTEPGVQQNNNVISNNNNSGSNNSNSGIDTGSSSSSSANNCNENVSSEESEANGGEEGPAERRGEWGSGEYQADAPSNPEEAANGERTILMGVFRAGNEDGVRGTSMRRHNIAAVTVSSSQRDSGADNRDVMRTRNRDNSGKHHATLPVNRKIHQNIRRLTHFIEEPNLGRGFIKELCISPDGRVICSPFGNGVRLLSFSPTMQDLSHCYPYASPIPLHEISVSMAHTDTVVSTKFSPYHNLLVSGCLSGKIVYYQPLL